MVLLGICSGNIPLIKMRNLYKKFTTKNTKEIILEAGHSPHHEIPELVNQHILDCVDSL